MGFVLCLPQFPVLGKKRKWSVRPSTMGLIPLWDLTTLLYSRGGGGTPLYGLYRYVPWNRVGFLEVLDP